MSIAFDSSYATNQPYFSRNVNNDGGAPQQLRPGRPEPGGPHRLRAEVAGHLRPVQEGVHRGRRHETSLPESEAEGRGQRVGVPEEAGLEAGHEQESRQGDAEEEHSRVSAGVLRLTYFYNVFWVV